jgi:hypothetical protein
MHNEDSIIKQFLKGLMKSDKRSIRWRWMILIILVLFLWILAVLFAEPNLFFKWYEANNTSQNTFDLLIHIIFWFFSPQVLLLVFSIFLGLFSAYEIASKYFAVIYGKINFIHSGISLWKRIFGVAKKESVKIDNLSINEKKSRYLAEAGGQARIVISAEYAAIFEKHDHSVQIVGPTMNLPDNQYLMENFEVLKDVVDLQNHSVICDAEICTKDGYPLVIRNLRAVFSVDRNSKTSTLTRPYPFNAQSVYSIFYQTPIGSLQEKFIEILKCELPFFARNYNFSDLIPNTTSEVSENNAEISESRPLEKFEKRKAYQFVSRKASNLFFRNHIHGNNKSARMNQKRVHFPFLYTFGYANKNYKKHIARNGNIMVDFFSDFQTYIKPKLIENGFQLVLLTRGTFEPRYNNFPKK